MKKTKYYFKVGGEYREDHDWGHIQSAAVNEGIRLYKDKSTGEIYSYEDVSKHTLATGEYVWEFALLRSEEVEIEPVVTKLPADTRYKNGYNWKNAHIRGANSRLRKPDPSADPYKKLNPKGKLPINPRTGRRDGGA
jgi:hypothetical protein